MAASRRNETAAGKVEQYLKKHIGEVISKRDLLVATKLADKAHAVTQKLSKLVKSNKLKSKGFGSYEVLPAIAARDDGIAWPRQTISQTYKI